MFPVNGTRPAAADRVPSPSAPSEGPPLVRLEGIVKTFGAVTALSGIDLDIPAGKVTALAGDNGAGKSVLIKCVAGIHTPDAGQIYWEGRPVQIRTPKEATDLGIATVYQDLALCDNLDIVENMFLGRETNHSQVLDEIQMELTARRTLADMQVTTVRSIRQPVRSLSGGQRQAVAVARAVLWKARLVIMDEPTAALGVSQTAQVLGLVRRLAEQGIGVLLISHNLNDVFSVADRLAVLHLGRLAATGPISDFDTDSAVHLITTGTKSGSTPIPAPTEEPAPPDNPEPEA